MASTRLLLRASRDVARAARIIASCHRRRAALPVAPSASGSAGPASLPSSSYRRHEPTNDASNKLPPGWREVEFLVEDGDLMCDRAMLTLYMRWCMTFNQQRDPDEILARFDRFKTRVRSLASMEEEEKSRSPYTLKLNPFIDGKYSRVQRRRYCRDGAPRGTRICLLSAWKPTIAASLPSSSSRRREPTKDAPAPCPSGLSNSNLRTTDYGSHKSPPGHTIKVADLVIDQERLVSDEDMWHVYKNWCMVFRQRHDHDEKLGRFHKFKEHVRRLASLDKSELGRYTIQLTPFDDGKLSLEA